MSPHEDVITVGSDDPNWGIGTGGLGRIPVVWTGDHYAVIWHHPAELEDCEATFLRLDPSGGRIGSPWIYPFITCSAFSTLVDNEAGFGLAYASDATTDLSLVLLDAEGKPIVGPLVIDDSGARTPRAVFGFVRDDAGFSAMWDSTRFVQVDPSGEARSDLPRDVIGERPANGSGMAWSGSSYMIGWIQEVEGSHRSRYAVLDDEGRIIVGPRTLGQADWAPIDVVWTGESFAAVWLVPLEDPEPGRVATLYMARVSRAGDLLGPPTADGSGPTEFMMLALVAAAGSGSVAVAWHDFSPHSPRVTRFDSFGTWIDAQFVMPEAVLHLVFGHLGIVFDGAAFALVVHLHGVGLGILRFPVERP